MSYSHRELKIAPAAQCPPAFESLKRPSEKANWPPIPNLEGRVSDKGVLGQPDLDLRGGEYIIRLKGP